MTDPLMKYESEGWDDPNWHRANPPISTAAGGRTITFQFQELRICVPNGLTELDTIRLQDHWDRVVKEFIENGKHRCHGSSGFHQMVAKPKTLGIEEHSCCSSKSNQNMHHYRSHHE